jgi:hypothetical protein
MFPFAIACRPSPELAVSIEYRGYFHGDTVARAWITLPAFSFLIFKLDVLIL